MSTFSGNVYNLVQGLAICCLLEFNLIGNSDLDLSSCDVHGRVNPVHRPGVVVGSPNSLIDILCDI